MLLLVSGSALAERTPSLSRCPSLQTALVSCLVYGTLLQLLIGVVHLEPGFQTGEALQVLTDGRLAATPHYVTAGKDVGTTSRETFAFFLQSVHRCFDLPQRFDG